jgi:PAS domain S-box-containing protein
METDKEESEEKMRPAENHAPEPEGFFGSQGERLFSGMAENSPMGYFRINREGCFELVNQAWLNMHGYDSPAEVLGRHFAITQVEGDLEQAQNSVNQLMSGAEIPGGEFSRRNKDGSVGWHVFSAWPVFSGRQVTGLEGFLIDISARKVQDQINAARLRLLEGAANRSLEELIQATLDELENLTGSQIGFYHFLSPDQQTLTLQTWSTRTLGEMCTAEGKGSHYPVSQAGVWVDCIRQGKAVIHNDYASLPAERRKGLPEGHAPVIRELVLPVTRSGMIVAILGVGNKPVDYTDWDVKVVSGLADLAWEMVETKRIEQILRKTSGEWYKIFDATTDAICLLDKDQNIRRANKSMSAMLGSHPRDLIGRKCWEVVHGTSEPWPDCPIQRMRTSLKRESMELTIGDKYYDVTVDPTPEAGAVHIIRDVTEKKRMERAIKNEMDKLEFMNSMMVDRELKMMDIEIEINALLMELGRPKKYR